MLASPIRSTVGVGAEVCDRPWQRSSLALYRLVCGCCRAVVPPQLYHGPIALGYGGGGRLERGVIFVGIGPGVRTIRWFLKPFFNLWMTVVEILLDKSILLLD
jgi:hypothetical protein